MTCAKLPVKAELRLTNGQTVWGSNNCHNPQPACPRLPGEDYAKCVSICMQPAHAEVMAIAHASIAYGGAALVGAICVVHGHTHACNDCLNSLMRAGVAEVRIHEPEGERTQWKR